MPDLGPLGRGGARRRTRRRMTAMNEAQRQQETTEAPESDGLEKLVKILLDKGVITEEEYQSVLE